MTANARILAWIGLLACAPTARAGENLYSIMLRDPDFVQPKIVAVYPESMPALWRELFARPESEYKIRAAAALARAHGEGMAGREKTVQILVAELEKKDRPALVKIAIVQALADLDAKDAAAAMFRASADGDIDVRQIVDPCLTRWQFEPVRAAWLERMKVKPSQRGTILAIRGLRAARDERAIPRLREIAMDGDELSPVRLEAAAAVADLRRTGWEADAKALAAETGPRGTVSRVVGATLLRHHDGPAATALLQSFVKDPEPAAAARAMARLVELDPAAVGPVLEIALAHPDAAVRLPAVESLGRAPTDDSLRKLGDRLADIHPDVRIKARQLLLQLFARPEWKDAVRREAMRILAGNYWGGLQQAAQLVGQIEHAPAVDRLIALQDHERTEVFVTAAWAFRTLNRADKVATGFDLFNARLKFAMNPANRLPPLTARALDEQMSQLAQYLGTQKYAPASAAFRKLIPPTAAPLETRAAAIWSLGKIHEGQMGLGFERAVEARLNAIMPMDVEAPLVRRMCAVTLARVGSKDAVKSLRLYYGGGPSPDDVGNACGWALERLTGEKVPPAVPVEQTQINFFAIPLGR